MEIKTRQTDDKPLTVIIEYPILDTKTQKLIKKIESLKKKVQCRGLSATVWQEFVSCDTTSLLNLLSQSVMTEPSSLAGMAT